jgi:REP element-mobilizing transposase RayT
MTRPRDTLISLDATPYYHCTSRCVRRSFLCGVDELTGQSYEHRRQWLEDLILELADIFAIDVCAYAIMSNHYHVVLHINQQQAESFSHDEVIQRWHRLHKGNLVSQRYVQGINLSEAELAFLKDTTDIWREKLMSISWFMRNINLSISQMANAEDQCTGHFWESRFKSQALLDEPALLSCMAYVDLNPIRANMAKTPEASDHTSIKLRITDSDASLKQLHPFIGNLRQNMPQGLAFSLIDYIELVEWTGRIIRKDKRGFIDKTEQPILKRLAQETDNWLTLTQHFEDNFGSMAGSTMQLTSACQSLKHRRRHDLKACSAFFG